MLVERQKQQQQKKKWEMQNFNKRSTDLDLLDSCSWDNIGNFLQTCIKNSQLHTKSIEI